MTNKAREELPSGTRISTWVTEGSLRQEIVSAVTGSAKDAETAFSESVAVLALDALAADLEVLSIAAQSGELEEEALHTQIFRLARRARGVCEVTRELERTRG